MRDSMKILIYILLLLVSCNNNNEIKNNKKTPLLKNNASNFYQSAESLAKLQIISYNTSLVDKFQQSDTRMFYGFEFKGNTKDKISVTVESQTTDTVVYLFEPAQNNKASDILIENDDINYPKNTNSAFEYTLQQSGVFLLVVEEFSGSSGDFKINFNCTSDTCSQTYKICGGISDLTCFYGFECKKPEYENASGLCEDAVNNNRNRFVDEVDNLYKDLTIREEADNNNQQPVINGDWYRPTPSVSWHLQLQNEINASYDLEIYDIDLYDSSEQLIYELQATGKKVICYFSAGTYEDWRIDADQFEPEDLGDSLDDWPGERWLDIRSENVRSIIKNRLDLAKQKGCDGVDPDNVDGYANNSGFTITLNEQVVFNRFIANEAHLRNLSVGLKNGLDQIAFLVDYYDFSINEQCFEYSECDKLEPFINNGKPVLNVEYKHEYVNDTDVRNELCNESLNLQFSTLILPLDLDDSFRLSCF